MGRANRLRLRDVRDALRLIGECRDLGADALAWREQMLQGLSRLLDAQVVVGGEVRLGESGSGLEPVILVDRGWPSDEARRHFHRYVAVGGMAGDPTLRACIERARPLVTRRREQIIDDRRWYASPLYNEFRRPAESDDWIGSVAALSEPDGFVLLSLDRPPATPRFTERQRRLVHFFHHELVRLIPFILARDTKGPLAALPPRLRQTLECLLEGDGEKQVAARLGLSRHTVHEYVIALYRRFDVSSRSELLVRILRRRGISNGT
jgi:DNA-binding CsgD family transcriptional regulator